MLKKLWNKIDEIRWEDAVDPTWWVKLVRHQVRLYFYILRELVRNRCPQQAAALTFTTLLSLVPLFAVAFSFFRGFAALDAIETRAQDAIFSSLLAGPLVERRTVEEIEEGTEPDEALPFDQMSAEEILARADERPRLTGVSYTLELYAQALGAGGDPERVRQGISTLRLGDVGSLADVFVRVTGSAQKDYFRAAGLALRVRTVREKPSDEATRYYDTAKAHHKRAEYTEALEVVKAAEKAGYPAVGTRGLAARSHAALADALLGQGEAAAAAKDYRAALAYYGDALFVSGGQGPVEEVQDLVLQHDLLLKKLGTALLELGKEAVTLRDSLQDREGVDGQEALQSALASLTEAATLLEHSNEVHVWLARIMGAAGKPDEAFQQYETAIRKSNEVAARGISLAVVDYLRLFVDKVGRAEIGILGILFLLVTATSLLNTTERTLNHIWKVTERRPFWIKFTSFCTLIWLGPVLVGTSVWVREGLADYFEAGLGQVPVIGYVVGPLTAVGEHLLPFVTTWLILMAVYKFLPHARVRFGSAAWGACLGAVLLHGARPLFSLYVLKAVRYQKIYGSLGAVPIFLLWLWLLWLIVLFGAEVSFTIQNVGLLRYRDKLHRLSYVFIDRYLAARIMMYVAREFWGTGEPLTASRLAEILHITSEEASDAAGRLVKLGLLTPVGEQRDQFHPARDLSKLKLSEVLSITDRFRDESRSVRPEDKPYEDKLEGVFRSAIQSQSDALKEMTFRDLLHECEKDRNKWPRGPSQSQ